MLVSDGTSGTNKSGTPWCNTLEHAVKIAQTKSFSLEPLIAQCQVIMQQLNQADPSAMSQPTYSGFIQKIQDVLKLPLPAQA